MLKRDLTQAQREERFKRGTVQFEPSRARLEENREGQPELFPPRNMNNQEGVLLDGEEQFHYVSAEEEEEDEDVVAGREQRIMLELRTRIARVGAEEPEREPEEPEEPKVPAQKPVEAQGLSGAEVRQDVPKWAKDRDEAVPLTEVLTLTTRNEVSVSKEEVPIQLWEWNGRTYTYPDAVPIQEIRESVETQTPRWRHTVEGRFHHFNTNERVQNAVATIVEQGTQIERGMRKRGRFQVIAYSIMNQVYTMEFYERRSILQGYSFDGNIQSRKAISGRERNTLYDDGKLYSICRHLVGKRMISPVVGAVISYGAGPVIEKIKRTAIQNPQGMAGDHRHRGERTEVFDLVNGLPRRR